MRFIILFALCFFALCSLALAGTRSTPPQINVKLDPYPVFTSMSIPELTGNIIDRNGDLARVQVNWGNGVKTNWDDIYGIKSVPAQDTLDHDVTYEQKGTYSITITAWDKRKKKVTKKLSVTVQDYTPELEEEACRLYGCESPDPDPEVDDFPLTSE